MGGEGIVVVKKSKDIAYTKHRKSQHTVCIVYVKQRFKYTVIYKTP